jgi:hypothetical protein
MLLADSLDVEETLLRLAVICLIIGTFMNIIKRRTPPRSHDGRYIAPKHKNWR